MAATICVSAGSASEKSLVALQANRELTRGTVGVRTLHPDRFPRRYETVSILYFELNRMNHKPKLVAVTDCSEGAGASTLAGGLAAALSETGDGKVLLVDMNVGRPEVHPFFRGTPACSLTEALVGAPAPAGENLYLAVATSPDAPAGSSHSKEILRLDAAPQGERLRLHYLSTCRPLAKPASRFPWLDSWTKSSSSSKPKRAIETS